MTSLWRCSTTMAFVLMSVVASVMCSRMVDTLWCSRLSGSCSRIQIKTLVGTIAKGCGIG